MGRIHAPEFEDFSWFPSWLRDPMTGFLTVGHRLGRTADFVVPELQRVSQRTNDKHIIDLATGGGGPVSLILDRLASEDFHFTVTDLYPNRRALDYLVQSHPDNLAVEYASIDATNVPEELCGIRTMFLSFHHLRSDLAQGVLQDAQDKSQPIVIFESFGRNFPSFISLLFSPVMTLLLMPFVRPFRWTNILFTYLVPLLPFFVIWDGLASWLRIYSPLEVRALLKRLKPSDAYTWEVKTCGPMSGPLIVGYPIVEPVAS